MRINLLTFNRFLAQKPLNYNPIVQNPIQTGGVSNPFAPIQKDSVEISFRANDFCSPKNFEIRNIPNLHCPTCGQIMLSEKQIEACRDDIASKKGQDLADVLEKYEDESSLTGQPSKNEGGSGVYRSSKKEIVDIYKALALEKPEMNLLELTRFESQRRINSLIGIQMSVINELEEYIKENYPADDRERKTLEKKVAKFTREINGRSNEPFSRKRFISSLEDCTSDNNKAGILEIVQKMPTSENDINSFFVKYARKAKTSQDVATALIQQSTSNAQHLKQKKGQDTIGNYICTCADCADKKGQTNFSQLIKDDSEIIPRLQDYVDDIQRAIDEDNGYKLLSAKYDSYVEKVIGAILEITNGEVILTPPESTNPKKKAQIEARRLKQAQELQAKAQQKDSSLNETAGTRKNEPVKSGYCSPKNFQVKQIANLRCPACGLIMLNEDQIGAFITAVSSKRGQELITTLEKYEDESYLTNKPSKDKTGFGIYRPSKKEIVDIIKDLAAKNTGLTLAGLAKLEGNNRIADLVQNYLATFFELENYIETQIEDGDNKKELLALVEKSNDQVKAKKEDSFARAKYIYTFTRATKDDKHRQEISRILNTLPTDKNELENFFVNCALEFKLTSSEVARKMVERSAPTAEHLKPKALGGKDTISNYICDCEECNNAKGDIPFLDWVQSLPEIRQRLQGYMNEVQVAIDENKLGPEYDTYIEKVIETIERISDGEVILKVPEITNPQKKDQALRRREQEVQDLREKNNKLIEQMRSLSAEIAKLTAYKDFKEVNEYREIKIRIGKINSKIEQLRVQIATLKNILYPLKKETDALREQIKTTKILGNKILLEQELEQKERQIRELTNQIDDFNKKIEASTKSKINLKRRALEYGDELEALKTRLESLRILNGKIKMLIAEIEALGDVVSKEATLLAEVAQLDEQIQQAQSTNETYRAKVDFKTSNTSDYNEYSRKKDILKTLENSLKNKEYRKLTGDAGLLREGIEFAIRELQKRITELEAKDEVQYFINLAIITSTQTRRENTANKLARATQDREKLETLQKSLLRLCDGKTVEEIDAELKVLVEEKETIDEILRIDEKRKKLASLKDITESNEEYLTKLRNYAQMTTSQYMHYVSHIEVDEAV